MRGRATGRPIWRRASTCGTTCSMPGCNRRRNLQELAFDGRRRRWVGHCGRSKNAFQGRPLAGVVVLTDGNATDLRAGALPDLTGLPPIYPVVIGRREPARDLAVQQVNVSQTAFEDAPVSILARSGGGGLPGRGGRGAADGPGRQGGAGADAGSAEGQRYVGVSGFSSSRSRRDFRFMK